MTNNIDKEYLKEVFEAWVREQVDNWIGEYGAWDHLIDDEISEEDWEYIRKNMFVGHIEINDTGDK